MFSFKRIPFYTLAWLIVGNGYAQDTNKAAATQDSAQVRNPNVKAAMAPTIPPDGKWSLQECIDYAIVYNISVKQSQLNVLSSQAALTQSRAGLLPNVNASIGYSYSTGRSLNTFTNTYEDNSVQSSPASLNANWNLFSGFQQVNLIRQNLLARQANQLTVEQQKNLAALNVSLNYIQALQNKELVRVSEFQVAYDSAQVERTQKLVDAGSLPLNNVLDLKAQLSRDQVTLVTAQNNLQLARLNLMQAMNLPATDNFDVEEITLPDPAIQLEYETSAQQIYSIAVTTQPNILSADRLVESSRRGVQAARGGFYPSLSLNGYYGGQYSNVLKDFTPDGTNTVVTAPISTPTQKVFVPYNGQELPAYSTTTTPNGTYRITPYMDQLKRTERKFVQVTLSIPIFNGFQTRYRVATAVIQQKNNELAAQSARITLRQNIEQAYTNMKLAAQQFVAYRNQVAAYELSFKAAQARFDVGALNSLDYTLAKNNLNQAQANMVQAKYNYVYRTKVLDFYQNKPLSF